MNSTLRSITGMGDRLTRWISQRDVDAGLVREVRSYVQSIRWKIRFLDHHSALLCAVQWDKVGRLGSVCIPEDMVDLRVKDGLLMRLGTSETVTMIIWTSFDGAVAACVNACDTLGRLINRVYGLGIDEHRANLPGVANKLNAKCPLGVPMYQEPGLQWMKPLRSLRGRCQHADLSEVLLQGYGSSALEPLVHRDYCLDGTEGIPVSDYASMVKARTLELLTVCANTITSGPELAVRIID